MEGRHAHAADTGRHSVKASRLVQFTAREPGEQHAALVPDKALRMGTGTPARWVCFQTVFSGTHHRRGNTSLATPTSSAGATVNQKDEADSATGVQPPRGGGLL